MAAPYVAHPTTVASEDPMAVASPPFEHIQDLHRSESFQFPTGRSTWSRLLWLPLSALIGITGRLVSWGRRRLAPPVASRVSLGVPQAVALTQVRTEENDLQHFLAANPRATCSSTSPARSIHEVASRCPPRR
jgi:hypothetical protein